MNKEIYWEEKSNPVSNFFTFLVGVINFFFLRSVIVAFVGIGLMTGGFVKWFAFVLTIFLSIMTYMFLSEQFKTVIIKSTLKYSIDEEGISYSYWLGSHRTITIPYESIISFHTLKIGKNIVTNKIYFNVSPVIDVADYYSFTDEEINLFCFDDIKEIDFITKILKEKIAFNQRPNFSIHNPEYLIKDTSRFSFVMNSVALAYLFLGFYLLISNLDKYALPSFPVEDVITKIESLYYEKGGNSYARKIYTKQGYSFEVRGTSLTPGSKITMQVSPILKNVTEAKANKNWKIEVPHYEGLIPGAQLLCSCLLLFCSFYIVKKNGVLPIQDMLFFIVLPPFLLIITYYM